MSSWWSSIIYLADYPPVDDFDDSLVDVSVDCPQADGLITNPPDDGQVVEPPVGIFVAGPSIDIQLMVLQLMFCRWSLKWMSNFSFPVNGPDDHLLLDCPYNGR